MSDQAEARFGADHVGGTRLPKNALTVLRTFCIREAAPKEGDRRPCSDKRFCNDACRQQQHRYYTKVIPARLWRRIRGKIKSLDEIEL